MPRPAARFIGQSVTRKEDQRLLTGHGLYVDDVTLRGHAPRRVPAQRDRGRPTITRLDTTAAKELPGVVAVFTWQDFDGRFGEAWHAMLGEELVGAAAARDHRRALRRRPGRARRRREPLPRRGRVRADRGRARAARRPCVDFATAADDTEHIVHGAWGLESNAMVAVPFTPLSPDLDEAFAAARHVVECTRSSRTATSACRWRPGGSSRRGRPGATRSTSSARRSRCTRPATSSPATSASPKAASRVTARDVGGGFGQKMFVFREECAVVLASRLLGRPVKWIEDRRENLIAAAALPQRARQGADGDRRRRRHPGDHRRARRRRRRVPAVPGGHGPDAARRARTRSRGSASRRRWSGPTRWARARTAARGCSRRRRARWRSTTPRARSARPGRVAAQEPARRRRPAVHLAGRQRVPGDHAARDARAGARDPRLRRVPQASRPRRAPRAATSASGSACTSSRRRWARRRSHTEGATVRVESERQGRRVPRHHVARPEHRDDDGAGRRRHLGVALRRRHHRPGRHAVDAVRPRHRRQPHRGRRRRRRAAATLAVRDKVARRSPRTRWRRRPTTSRSPTAGRVGAGHADASRCR